MVALARTGETHAMAATRTKPGKAAAKPAVKLRGQRQPMAISMPPDLVAEIDEIAATEGRSRAKQIEIVMRQFVQSYHRRPAAA
jgi:hypothetical protein